MCPYLVPNNQYACHLDTDPDAALHVRQSTSSLTLEELVVKYDKLALTKDRDNAGQIQICLAVTFCLLSIIDKWPQLEPTQGLCVTNRSGFCLFHVEPLELGCLG
jgi:hypothetical protein